MSTQPKSIRLPDAVMTALQEAAKREKKPLEQMAGEAIMAGLLSRGGHRNRLLDLIDYGTKKAQANDMAEKDPMDVVHEWRKEKRQHHKQ